MALIAPTVETIGDAALTNSIIDKSITEFQDELVTDIREHAFYNCTTLKKAVFGSVSDVADRAFDGCTALATADFHTSTPIGDYAFNNCPALTALILRGATVCHAVSGTFQNSGIASGNGYIYVPAALVDSYKTATNWSTYASQFRAIEDYPAVCGSAGKVWTRCTDDGKSFDLVAYANGIWVAAAYGLYYSDDGITWTKALSTSYQVEQILYADGIWVVAGGSNKKTYVSTDGKSWTTVSTTTTALAYGNGVFVGTTGSSGLMYSADGLTWTQSSVATGSIRDVVYADGFFLATPSSDNVYKSVDGVTWETFAFPGGSLTTKRLVYGNGIFVLGGLLSGTYSMYFSTDGGETWTRSPQSFGTVQRVHFRNGLFYVGEKNGVWVSSDGESWEKTAFTSAYINFVQYENGIWLTSVNDKMYYSYDGLEWVEASPSFSAKGAAFDGSKWVAASTVGLYYSE